MMYVNHVALAQLQRDVRAFIVQTVKR